MNCEKIKKKWKGLVILSIIENIVFNNKFD